MHVYSKYLQKNLWHCKKWQPTLFSLQKTVHKIISTHITNTSQCVCICTYKLLCLYNLRKYVLTEKIWEYLIRLVYDVITLGTAVAFLQASSYTFIAGFKSMKKKKRKIWISGISQACWCHGLEKSKCIFSDNYQYWCRCWEVVLLKGLL